MSGIQGLSSDQQQVYNQLINDAGTVNVSRASVGKELEAAMAAGLSFQEAAAKVRDDLPTLAPPKNPSGSLGGWVGVASPMASVNALITELCSEQRKENREAMTQAAEQVKTGQITFAVRDTVFEDKEIKEGDIIGIHNGRIETVGTDVQDIAVDLVGHVVEEGDSLITIYYGQDTKEEDAQALGTEIAGLFSDLDVEVQYGGQPLYYYLISAE